MENRLLGRTKLVVSPLGFGAAEIGFEKTPVSVVERLLGAALDAGLNVIDTAECYQDSESKIGRALGSRRKSCLLFTKCGHASGLNSMTLRRGLNKLSRMLTGRDQLALQDWQRGTLKKSIEQSLRLLRTDYLDILQLHSCPEEILRQGEVVEILQQARQAGKTRFIGYSGDGAAALYAIRCATFDTLQTSVNIADQEAIDLTIPAAAQLGMGIIAKRPIANAVWRNSAKPDSSYQHAYWTRLNQLKYGFLEEGDTSFGTALRFTLTIPGVQTAIVGTTKPERWIQNANALNVGPLDPEQFRSIRARWKLLAGPDWVGQT
jgi:aryl-alcohol dehydrogenase-like predicted oxidoreductase